MTASIIGTAAAAFVASLQSAPAVTASVSRTKVRPLVANVSEAVVVRVLGAEAGETNLTTGQPVSWLAHIAVEMYKRAAPGVAPDEAVDPLLTAVYARLMSESTLGGAVRQITPGALTYDYDAQLESDCCATFTFFALVTAAPNVFTP